MRVPLASVTAVRHGEGVLEVEAHQRWHRFQLEAVASEETGDVAKRAETRIRQLPGRARR